MEAPAAHRLIMITGSAPGAGKTTLMRQLTEYFERQGVTVLRLDEDDVWGRRETGLDPVDRATARPEFITLLHGNSRPAPSDDDILRVFEHFRDQAQRDGAVWIQDWAWPLLALPMSDGRSRVTAASPVLAKAAAPLQPIVLYLDASPARALRRAIAERGRIWFNRHAGHSAHADCDDAAIDALASDYQRLAEWKRQVLDSSWETIDIDADADPAIVLLSALSALRVNRADEPLAPF